MTDEIESNYLRNTACAKQEGTALTTDEQSRIPVTFISIKSQFKPFDYCSSCPAAVKNKMQF